MAAVEKFVVLLSLWLLAPGDATQRAMRICRPPPPCNATCHGAAQAPVLLVGDSVSIGYTGPLAQLLAADGRELLHAPFSGDGGACDTRYGLQCAGLWLNSSLAGEAAPRYAAVAFNFGLHDTNDLAFDEEARDEHVPAEEYGANVAEFARRARAAQPQAKLLWLWSTPMHFDMHLEANVQEYNAVALRSLAGGAGATVDATLDLHSAVTAACGPPPYYASQLSPNATRHCPLINDNEEYHYNADGYQVLAGAVAAKLRSLLPPPAVAAPAPAPNAPPNAAAAVAAAATAAAAAAAASTCPDGVTACPGGATCIRDTFSKSGWGCCLHAGAVDCGDSWHCCAADTVCRSNGTNPLTPGQPPRPGPYSHVCEYA
eukprot:g2662.t1